MRKLGLLAILFTAAAIAGPAPTVTMTAYHFSTGAPITANCASGEKVVVTVVFSDVPLDPNGNTYEVMAVTLKLQDPQTGLWFDWEWQASPENNLTSGYYDFNFGLPAVTQSMQFKFHLEFSYHTGTEALATTTRDVGPYTIVYP